MKKNKKFFSLVKEKQTATLNIYGDITGFPFFEGDVSSHSLSEQLKAMNDVSQIDVYINSSGGDVGEGLAIYNALRRHKAKVRTYCDGFVCSIASVIFMAGDERVMCNASMLMIHNAWTGMEGNANDFRKMADDLDEITQRSVEVYESHSSLSEKEIQKLMDKETWISPKKALEYGFATSIEGDEVKSISQSARQKLFNIVMEHQEKEDEEEEPENDLDDEEEEDPDNDTGGEENPENDPETPSDEEDEEGEEEQSEEEEDPETDEEQEVAQLWSGFFNALLK